MRVSFRHCHNVRFSKYSVTCQTRTALVKVSLRSLIVYFLPCQLAHLGVLRDSWPVSRRSPAAWRFTGDPAPLARDNSDAMERMFALPPPYGCCPAKIQTSVLCSSSGPNLKDTT